MQQSNNKIAYLDGLRGLAALLVFFHHFFQVFYTSFYTWDPRASHLNGWEIKYGESVFSVFTNGNFWVCIFFVLSGFVLSRKYFNEPKISTLVSAAQRRFLRLYIPVAFTLILSFLLLSAHLYYNIPVSKLTHSEWRFGNMWVFDHPAKRLLKCLISDTMFEGDASFDTSMWTMTFEVYYSFVVFAFLALTHNTQRRHIGLLAMLVFCLVTYNGYLAAFICGIGLNYIKAGIKPYQKRNMILTVPILLLSGLILGSYPSYGNPAHTFFHALSSGSAVMLASTWFHTIGAVLIVAAILRSPALQAWFSFRLFRLLGYISFSLYLLHPLVIGSFSSYMFLRFSGILSYNVSVIIVLATTLLVCIIVSWLMTRYIDDMGIRLSKYVYTRYFKTTKSGNE